MTKVFCDTEDCGYNKVGTCTKDYIILKFVLCEDYVKDEEEEEE